VVSAGALIYVSARRENRVCLPNTRFMLHQPLGGVGGPAADVEVEAAQIIAAAASEPAVRSRDGPTRREERAGDPERNFWMTASEARDYGLVSRIVERLGDA
jgi:ATP-dependent Clp protease, protease subunit